MTKLSTQNRLIAVIKTYLSSTASDRSLSPTKANITRLVDRLGAEIGFEAARKIAFEVVEANGNDKPRTQILKQRLTVGSLYLEGDRVFGWWSEDQQAQAEPLPLRREHGWLVAFNDSDRGFYVAENLPIIFDLNRSTVSFCLEQSKRWSKLGYAVACDIPYCWNGGVFLVTRSIISEGFWVAYKWWENCKWWYYEKHPDWFADDEIWGEDLPAIPPDNPYAAVLGKINREHWESKKLNFVTEVES